MNKKLIAVAVGSAVGALGSTAAFAQSSTVTLSGNLNFYYGYIDNGGAGYTTPNATTLAGTAKVRTDGMSNSESEWVLDGRENLGGGMEAYFKCSTSLDIVGGTAANMCARNSFIGLKTGYGSFSWGNYDTPQKRTIALFDPFPIAAAHGQGAHMFGGTASNVSGSGGGFGPGNSTTTSTNAASFSRRQSNLFTYDMPTMNGFDLAFAYSAANDATAATSASTIQKPRLWSTGVSYTNGPLALGAAYERHIDFNAAQTSTYLGGRDSSYQLGAAYTFMGSLRLSAIYVNMKYENLAGGTLTGQDMSVNAYGVYADWAISGPHRLRLGYNNQASTKGTYNGTVGVYNANAGAGQTGAQKYIIEYAYALSKRTELNLAYSTMRNDRASNITIGTGANTPNYGESQNYFGLRVNHKF